MFVACNVGGGVDIIDGCNVGGGVDIAVRLAVGIGDTFVDIVVNLSVGVRVVSCVIGVADGGNVMNGSVKGGGV